MDLLTYLPYNWIVLPHSMVDAELMFGKAFVVVNLYVSLFKFVSTALQNIMLRNY